MSDAEAKAQGLAHPQTRLRHRPAAGTGHGGAPATALKPRSPTARLPAGKAENEEKDEDEAGDGPFNDVPV